MHITILQRHTCNPATSSRRFRARRRHCFGCCLALLLGRESSLYASSGFQLLGSRSHISSTRPKVEHIWNPENETEQSVRVFQDQNRRVALRLIPSLQDLCDFSCACFFFMSCCVPLCSLSDATTVPEAHATSSAVLPSIRTKYGLCEFRSGVLLFIAFHA